MLLILTGFKFGLFVFGFNQHVPTGNRGLGVLPPVEKFFFKSSFFKFVLEFLKGRVQTLFLVQFDDYHIRRSDFILSITKFGEIFLVHSKFDIFYI